MADSDEATELIQKHRFVLRTIIIAWRIIAVCLGIGGIAGGAAVIFGPANAHGGVTFRLMSSFGSLNIVVACVMVIGGLMILVSDWTETWGHLILGVTYGWWGWIVIYIIFILDQDSSVVGVTWSLLLAAVHFIAAGGRLAIWQFMRKLQQTQTVEGGDGG